MTETTEVTGPPKKKHSLVTALLMMGLGGFWFLTIFLAICFPAKKKSKLEPLLLKPLLMRSGLSERECRQIRDHRYCQRPTIPDY